MKYYRLCISSRGCFLKPVEFPAESDEEALKEARRVLKIQKESDPQGTAGIVYLRRIDVREKTTEIKTS
jgi:hypothetical protein